MTGRIDGPLDASRAGRADTARPDGAPAAEPQDDVLRLPGRPPEPQRAPSDPAAASPGEVAALVRQSGALREENQGLRASLDESRQVADERARRVQQLLGERSQLEARLAEAHRQVQQLNRELGALSVRVRADGAVHGRAWERVSDWLGRVGAGAGRIRLRATTAAAPPADPAPGAEAPLVPFAGEAPLPLVGVAVFGLGGPELARVLDVVERRCRARRLRPLVLTDHDGLELFRARRLAFEYLPPSAPGRAGDAFELYLQRRLALIRRKWRPVRIVAFGPRAAGVVRLWRESPFEEPGLEALVSGRADRA